VLFYGCQRRQDKSPRPGGCMGSISRTVTVDRHTGRPDYAELQSYEEMLFVTITVEAEGLNDENPDQFLKQICEECKTSAKASSAIAKLSLTCQEDCLWLSALSADLRDGVLFRKNDLKIYSVSPNKQVLCLQIVVIPV
jgi:hypothetical protein